MVKSAEIQGPYPLGHGVDVCNAWNFMLWYSLLLQLDTLIFGAYNSELNKEIQISASCIVLSEA